MPLNAYLFGGAVRQLHGVAAAALVLKLLSVVGMMVIMVFSAFLGFGA